jgi:hypothetical protein
MTTHGITASSSSANGHATIGETLYALTDEQILDIDDAEVAPPPRPATAREDVIPSEPLGSARSESRNPSASSSSGTSPQKDSSTVAAENAAPSPNDNAHATGSVGQTSRSVPDDARHAPDAAPSATKNRTDVDARPTAPGAEAAPPEWLAQAMNDLQRGGEARQFWESGQQARAQAAQLASLDQAYFGARDAAPAELAASRDVLAQQLLREDPAAFREMLAAGLRALGVKDVAIPTAAAGSASERGNRAADSSGRQASPQNDNPTRATHESLVTGHESLVTEYAAFERAANDDLDRAVRPEISRIVERALPAGNNESTRVTRERLSGQVHSEIEVALRQDRALGEQVAQLLRARSFDEGTRAQVVRLIAARAASLVPEASRRVLAEWTQSALAAHRARRSSGDSSSSSAIPSPSAPPGGNSTSERSADAATADPSATISRTTKNAAHGTRHSGSRRIDYHALSDEQILDL